MIRAEHLSRSYGDFVAVDDVSFEIAEGEVVGLLGHNGAGKTTIMKMLTGFLEPSAGRVMIDGRDMDAARSAAQALMGYLPENCPVYPDMSVAAFLDYAAELRGAPAAGRETLIRDAIRATRLEEKSGAPISALSRGLRQRVGVAQAILHRPKIVILDEPTNGLDPSQIREMRALIRALAERATVILSTHILQEVAAVCDRVLIVNRGRLALDAPLEGLGAANRLRLVTSLPLEAARAALAGVDALAALAPARQPGLGAEAHAFEAKVAEGASTHAAAAAAAAALIAAGGAVYALHPLERDLEAVFADISSGPAGEPAGPAAAAGDAASGGDTALAGRDEGAAA